VVAEGNKEVKETGNGKAVKDIDEPERKPHGRTGWLRRSKEEVTNEVFVSIMALCIRYSTTPHESAAFRAEAPDNTNLFGQIASVR